MIKDVALLSPIFVTFFWSLVFFIQPGEKDKPKIILGIFMVFAFLLYCTHAVYFNKSYALYSYIESIYLFSMLVVYPLYYCYLVSLTTQRFIRKNTLLPFAPALFFGILALILTFFLNHDERVLYVKEILVDRNINKLNINTLIGVKGIVFFISRMIFLIQVAYFGIKGVQLANRHNRKIEEYYSNIEGKTLNWVRLTSMIIIVTAIASIIFTFIGRPYFSRNEVSLLVPSVIFSVFLFVIGLKGNHQIQVSTDFEPEKTETDFSEVKSERLKNLLIQLFDVEKIYKDPELRISVISEALNTNRTYISKLINEEFQMNFNEFVNKYRIEEAKELLKANNSNLFTLELIAERSGFGSLNSINRVFKAATGLTPGHFRNKNINVLQERQQS